MYWVPQMLWLAPCILYTYVYCSLYLSGPPEVYSIYCVPQMLWLAPILYTYVYYSLYLSGPPEVYRGYAHPKPMQKQGPPLENLAHVEHFCKAYI